MGGILIRPQISKNFACGGPRKPRFQVFWSKKNSACGGQKLWLLSFSECKKAFLSFVKVSSRRASAVPVVFYECRNARLLFVKVSSHRTCSLPVRFTRVGTRVYYSQNDFAAAQTWLPEFSRAQERAFTIRKTLESRARMFLSFHKCRNVCSRDELVW